MPFVQVLRISSLQGTGVDELWDTMRTYRQVTTQAGELSAKRERQLQVWMWNHIRDRILHNFRQQPRVVEKVPELESMVRRGAITPGLAADVLLERFFEKGS